MLIHGCLEQCGISFLSVFNSICAEREDKFHISLHPCISLSFTLTMKYCYANSLLDVMRSLIMWFWQTHNTRVLKGGFITAYLLTCYPPKIKWFLWLSNFWLLSKISELMVEIFFFFFNVWVHLAYKELSASLRTSSMRL